MAKESKTTESFDLEDWIYKREGIGAASEQPTRETEDKLIEYINDRLGKLEEKVEAFGDRIHKQAEGVISTLAIFVSLFTFISVEFQIFREIDAWPTGAGFSLLLLGSLLFFNGSIYQMNHLNYPRRKSGILSVTNLTYIVLPIVLIIVGVFFLALKLSSNESHQNPIPTPTYEVIPTSNFKNSTESSNSAQ